MSDAAMERNDSTKENLLNEIKIIYTNIKESLFFNENYETHKKRKLIPIHEGKLNIACHPHKNVFNIYKDLL